MSSWWVPGRWARGPRSGAAGRADHHARRRVRGGHARATSGDETRIIRSSHGDGPAVHGLVAHGPRRLDRVRRAGRRDDLRARRGALVRPPRGRLRDASEALAARDWDPGRAPDAGEVTERWPQVAAGDLAFAAFEPEAGLLMARRGVAAVARRFIEEGGRFDLAWARPGRADGRRLLEVTPTTAARWPADQFVFAGGPWLPRLFPRVLGDLIRVTKQDVIFMGPPAGDGRFGADRCRAGSTTTPRSTASPRPTAGA